MAKADIIYKCKIGEDSPITLCFMCATQMAMKDHEEKVNIYIATANSYANQCDQCGIFMDDIIEI